MAPDLGNETVHRQMSKRSPYDVLGVPKGTDDEAIKKAFRKRAKELHPDRNAKDPKAQERFSELNTAYEILGDKEKRRQFDGGQIDAEGKPRFHGFEGMGAGGQGGGFSGFRGGQGGPGGPNMEEIFRQFGFGGGSGDPFADLARGRRGPNINEADPFGRGPPSADTEGELVLTLEEAAAGGKKRVTLPSGKEGDVAFPAGVEAGQVIRLRGQGRAASLGRPAGDLLLKVRHAAHDRFALDGKHLRIGVAVPLAEAVLGGSVRVPTLTGAIDLTIPQGTDGGKVFRLKGKGFPAAAGAGDLLVRIDIAVPKGDAELEALMRMRRAKAKAG
jgi:DnaJ-class molecular chaperone